MMWRLRQRLRQVNEDHGYSLLELVITVAILASVGAGISALMLSGTRLYGAQSATLRLQNKAQLLSAQLRTYFTEASEFVYEDAETLSPETLVRFSGMESCFVYGNEEAQSCILYDAEAGRLYYGEGLLAEETFTADEIVRDFPLLAQDVSDFQIAFPESADGSKNSRMETSFTLKDHGATYDVHFVTALRNHKAPVAETDEEDTP